MIPVKRTDIRLKANPRKVILKFLDFANPARFEPVIHYVLSLDEDTAKTQLQSILDEFAHRHFDLQGAFLENFQRLETYIQVQVSEVKKLLLGAYFTHEYSIEAAASFNPSIVPHPDQSGLKEGELRFILSLRSTGEGHISSVAFQTGVMNAAGEISLQPAEPKLTRGRMDTALTFDKDFVLKRIDNKSEINEIFRDKLPEKFTRQEALAIMDGLEKHPDATTTSQQVTEVFDLNYDLHFNSETPLGSRVIFPNSLAESNGMEDVRFVQMDDGGYLGTYTAYNGRTIRPQLIETRDFLHFKIRPFYGKAASDKGMALFPEKINGKYAMIGRQGGRSLSVMFSNDLYFWEEHQPLQHPERGWEILQMGNCGSPVKTPQGWLLLKHAVGPMRKYVLSMSLLDLTHPEKVLASLDMPLMSPNEEEREGYVPNVLYTCGMMKHGENLVIPYAMSDSAISFALVKTADVLNELLNENQ